ncbi:protein C-mannosyl-transferase DPY19L1 isoform X2 [Prorops nasuta]|uniref:protein C-mannosyl-transferase DPY19L1 isoform X2 n=1 Tax=Prorops nasuta TaxID=863751 RepID=UPI0034CDE4C7
MLYNMAPSSDRDHRNSRENKPQMPTQTRDYYSSAICLLAIGFGLIHRWHVSTLFENNRHFSHLSEIEREMSFRTEMGLYYSYYKTIAESNSFSEGAEKISNDKLSEYGNVINAARKYNLSPEIMIGWLYHLAKELGIFSKEECWQIERGEGLAPVRSCEGLAVPVYFYLEMVWLFSIYTAAILFLYSTIMNNSIFSGVITILSFFYNHNEATRVQWTPPLRESFAYPIILCQIYGVTLTLTRYAHIDSFQGVMLSTMLSLNSWQFSHFVFATQIFALLILKWCNIIPYELYRKICLSHFVAAVLATLQSDGTLIFCSLYMCLLVSSNATHYLFKWLHFENQRTSLFFEIVITLTVFVRLKTMVLVSDNDSHIYNLLASKLEDYRDFHTMLYTCSAEFDFLQYKTFETLVKTYLLPTAILSGILALYYWYRNFKVVGFPRCVEPDVAYSGLQTGAFIIMAVFIMRLKLFMTPHLCIIAGSVCNKKYLEKLGLRSRNIRTAIVVLVIAMMSIHGIDNLRTERSYINEYSNVEQEELFEWVKNNTPETAVFAGKMSLMANLMLSTRRAIVNNPYYESKEMRDRTMKVYSIFSRMDAASVYITLRSLKADYVILEEPLCLGYVSMKPGCQMVELWDLSDKGTAKYEGKPPLCPILFQGHAYPFRRVFVNSYYVVLQLDYSYYVEFKPKNAFPTDFQS